MVRGLSILISRHQKFLFSFFLLFWERNEGSCFSPVYKWRKPIFLHPHHLSWKISWLSLRSGRTRYGGRGRQCYSGCWSGWFLENSFLWPRCPLSAGFTYKKQITANDIVLRKELCLYLSYSVIHFITSVFWFSLVQPHLKALLTLKSKQPDSFTLWCEMDFMDLVWKSKREHLIFCLAAFSPHSEDGLWRINLTGIKYTLFSKY